MTTIIATRSRFINQAEVVARALAARAKRPRKYPVKIRRVLLAHHLLLGDTLMLTPLISKLRARYPEADIVMTAPRAIAPL
jgi:3-deoxy-D-manno-octulosonic-acid transferase